MIYQTLLSAAVIACMLFSEPIVCLASTQNVAKIKDILCVLILNGVEKDDLDENTLRKLEKMHVNINDWNNVYKRDCEKNIGLAQPAKHHREHWTAFGTELPLTSTTDETVDTKSSNLIKLPKLEEMLNSFETTNMPKAEKVVAINDNNVQATTKQPEPAINNSNLDNVLNFWNQFRQDKENPSIITTMTEAAHNEYATSLVKNAQLEKPKMLFEDVNASRITDFVNNNNDYSIEKPQLKLTTGQPNFNNHFNQYAEFFDVMYKKFLGLNNQQNSNQNGLKNSFIPDVQNIPSKDNPMSTESYKLKLANIALNTWPETVQRPYATAVSMPIHILQVKPIKINYVQSDTTKEPEKNGSQIYSETVKEIANEVKAMLLAQLKKEIPLITLTCSTEAPTTTTTMLSVKIRSQQISKPIPSPIRKEPLTRDQSSESSETRKKLEETNGMVKKLFGLFQKLEVVQKKAFSTFQPVLASPVPAPKYLPSLSLGFATTSTSNATRDNLYRTGASKNTAMNKRPDPYRNLPTFNNMPYNNMPYHNIQYNSMQYSVLPPKPMSPYLPMPGPMSYPRPPYNTNPPKMYNIPNNPMENQYNYQMIKPSMVAINAKMIQTNEFIVMPLRVPINVKGQRADVQRLIDNQNIVLNNTLRQIKPTTTTTTTTSTTTTQTYDTFSKPERNNYWIHKKNTHLENSREREKYIESIDRERTIDSRERENLRYSSREGRDDRTHESVRVNTNYHHLPRSHFKKSSQFLSERDRNYDRHTGFQSDETPIYNKYHDDYKGPKYAPDQIYVNQHLHGQRVDYHPHPKITLHDTRDPVRDEPAFYNREPPRDKTKFFNRDPVKEDHQFFNREPLRDEHKHFNREPTRDEPKHFNREPLRDDFERELPRDEAKFYNIEPRVEPELSRDHSRQPKLFNLEPPRVKYEKPTIHDPRDPAEPLPISDSFEKLINGESVESQKDYPHRDIAPINKAPVKASKFNEKHFKNFLSTQQKVNSMLEKILSAKTQGSRLR